MSDIDVFDLTLDIVEIRKKYPAICARYLKRTLKEETNALEEVMMKPKYLEPLCWQRILHEKDGSDSHTKCEEEDEVENSNPILCTLNLEAKSDEKQEATSINLSKKLHAVKQEAEEVRKAMEIIKANKPRLEI